MMGLSNCASRSSRLYLMIDALQGRRLDIPALMRENARGGERMRKSRFDRDKKTSFSFTLNRAEYEDLEALAKKHGLNMSAMICKLIADATEGR